MRLAVLWLVLAVVAVGLPALALLADRAAARRPPGGPGEAMAFARAHRLTAAEAEALEQALRRGTTLEDPRLGALAHARAAQELPRVQRQRRRLTALAVTAALVAVAVVVASHRDPALPFVLLVNPALQFAAICVRVRRLRQARDANAPA